MSQFRRYLDRAALPHDEDHEKVVHYYALPHFPDPSAHPAFEALFDDAWSVSISCLVAKYIHVRNIHQQYRQTDDCSDNNNTKIAAEKISEI